MREVWSIILFALPVACAAPADTPEPAPQPRSDVLLDAGPPVTVEQGRKCILTVQTTAKKVTWGIPPGCDTLPLDGKRLAVWALPGTYTFRVMVPSGDDVISTELVLTVTGPRPPPIPPDPKPPEPKPPEPLKSFRVILIYESGDTLTAQQNSVIYGKVVEDYLTATCTGGKNGWRRRDKDSPGEADTTMAALWAAIKPNVTATPCVAVERNGKVDIIPLEPTPAAMVAKLKAYAEGK